MEPKAELPTSGEMTLMEHLDELRSCLVWAALAITIGSVLAYSYVTPLFDILAASYRETFPGEKLIGTGPAEAFILKIKVAIFAGVLLSSPIVFLQLWRFIAPGLYPHERRFALPFVASTTLLFCAGVWFCHRFVLPVAFSFFYGEYQSIGVSPNVRVTEHLSFVIQALLAFGAVFELPVLAYFLGRFGIVTSTVMVSGARYAVVVIFVISAVLTPPDVISQFLMAIPMLVLYAISIVVVRLTEQSPEEREAKGLSSGPT